MCPSQTEITKCLKIPTLKKTKKTWSWWGSGPKKSTHIWLMDMSLDVAIFKSHMTILIKINSAHSL